MPPAWPPTTEDDLRNAAAAGALEERHFVDVKSELAPGDRANKELAADLASFAVDGGRLIFGVDEGNAFALTPVVLAGLPERIELVARSRVDEPLYVEFTTIRTRGDPARGYVVVAVPMSPRAPHQAGNRYWYRGDKTKFPLPDAEVERLIAQRRRWESQTEPLLDEWIARDPIGPPNQQRAHLFVVCVPVPRKDEMLVKFFAGDWQETLRGLVAGATRPGEQISPDLLDVLAYFNRRARGWSGSSQMIDIQRRAQPQGEHRFIELEITEAGVMQVVDGRITEPFGDRTVMFETACLGMAYRMVKMAAIVSTEVGFLGSWDFAVGVSGLKGAISYLRPSLGFFEHPVYTEDTYRSSTRASRQEIEANPGAVVERLFGRLMRAIGMDQAAPLQVLLGRSDRPSR